MKKIKLSELRTIELAILDKFVEICEENNLRYYLIAGTLIGAVRHKGFIPWDDDIDVSMPRPDYEKLKKILHNKLIDGQYQLLTYENRGTKYNFMKMVNVQTVLYEKYMTEEIGVWIDIFPIDGLPDSYLLTRLLCIKLEFFRRLLLISFAVPDVGKTAFRKCIKRIVRFFIHKNSSDKLFQKVNNIFVQYDYNTSKYVGDVSGGASYKGRVKKSVYKSKYAEFEKKQYCIPEGYDSILRNIYGNYMELPPENKRVQHEFKAYWKDEAETRN